MSVHRHYGRAIRSSIEVGLKGHIPEINHEYGVMDADDLAQANRPGSPNSRLPYPFVAIRVEDEGPTEGANINPPRESEQLEVSSVNSDFAKDILQRAEYLWDTRLTVSVYESMTDANGRTDYEAKYRCEELAHEVANYFAMWSDGRVSPLDGGLEGLHYVLIDPDTGEYVDQDDPPETAIFPELVVMSVGRIQNVSTMLNDAMGEHRREFPVQLGGVNAYEIRLPTLERIDVDVEMAEPQATPSEPLPPWDLTDPEVFIEYVDSI